MLQLGYGAQWALAMAGPEGPCSSEALTAVLSLGGLARAVWPGLLLFATGMQGGTRVETRRTLAACQPAALRGRQRTGGKVKCLTPHPPTTIVVNSERANKSKNKTRP